MSIEITDKNLSKFHKRLKAALSEMFPEQSISLSQSAELFAKASGFKTSHDLQKILSVSSNTIPDSSDESIHILKNAFSVWKDSIDKKIKQHMENNPETVFQIWTWGVDDFGSFLSFGFLDDKNQDGGHSLYLDGSNCYETAITYESVVNNSGLKKIDSKKYKSDMNLLKEIMSAFPKDRYKNSVYQFGVEEFIELQLSRVDEPIYSHSECLISQKNPVVNYYGGVKQDYIVVKEENAAFSFDDTGKWVYADANEREVKYSSKSLKSALSHLDEDSMLFERVHNNNNAVKSCLFIIKKDGSFLVNDVGQYLESMSFKTENDLITFRAKQAFSEKKFVNPYYINDGRFLIWKKEHETYLKSLEPKNQVKKVLKVSR